MQITSVFQTQPVPSVWCQLLFYHKQITCTFQTLFCDVVSFHSGYIRTWHVYPLPSFSCSLTHLTYLGLMESIPAASEAPWTDLKDWKYAHLWSQSILSSHSSITWSVVMQFQANSVKSWATSNYQCRSSQLTSIFLSLSCPPSVKSCVVLFSFSIASSSSLSIRCNRPSASLSCTWSMSLRFQCGTVGVVIIMFTNYHTDPNTHTHTH